MEHIGHTRREYPKYATIKDAPNFLGIQRSKIYELAGRGKLKIIKVGNRSLVDMDHALAWMATLPEAQISPVYRRN